MITLITGVPGAGKTAFAVSELMKSTKDVYVLNLRSKKFNEIKDIEELTTLRNAVVLIDEVQAYLTSDKHKYFFETHRHHGVDIFMTTQGHSSIPRWLRPLVGRHVHITSASLSERRYLEWPRIANPLSQVDVRAADKKFAPVRKEAFEYYDSVEEGAELPAIGKRKIPLVYFILASIIPLIILLAVFGTKKLNSVVEIEEKETPVTYEEKTVELVPVPLEVVNEKEEETDLPPPPPPEIVGCVRNGDDCRCYDSKATIVLEGKECRETNKFLF